MTYEELKVGQVVLHKYAYHNPMAYGIYFISSLELDDEVIWCKGMRIYPVTKEIIYLDDTYVSTKVANDSMGHLLEYMNPISELKDSNEKRIILESILINKEL